MTYSNCLFEALKAKLRDPSHIRIMRFPRVLTRHLHFGWTDGEFFYHAYDPRFFQKSLLHRNVELVYRYKVKKIPLSVFESYLFDRIRFKPIALQKKILKKYHMRIAEIPYTSPNDGWSWVFDDSDLPAEADVRYMEKLFRCTVFIKVAKTHKYIKTMTYEQVMNIKARNGWRWRYVTPMDKPDFEALYDTFCRVRAEEIQPTDEDTEQTDGEDSRTA